MKDKLRKIMTVGLASLIGTSLIGCGYKKAYEGQIHNGKYVKVFYGGQLEHLGTGGYVRLLTLQVYTNKEGKLEKIFWDKHNNGMFHDEDDQVRVIINYPNNFITYNKKDYVDPNNVFHMYKSNNYRDDLLRKLQTEYDSIKTELNLKNVKI